MNGRQATIGHGLAVRVTVNHRRQVRDCPLRGPLLAARDTPTGHCAQRNHQMEQKSWACHEFKHMRPNRPSGPAEALACLPLCSSLLYRPYCRVDTSPSKWSAHSAQADPRILNNCFIRRETQNHNSTFWTQMRFIPDK